MAPDSISGLAAEVAACRLCPRLVEWRVEAAANPPARFAGQRYWAGPLSGFGDPNARVLVVGLAPAAHGGNRTGRVFTGDRSGDFLFASLHRTGFANQAESTALDDGLELRDAYIAAAVRCAPPANKPTPLERDTSMPYLVRELQLLTEVRVIVVLGAFGYEATWTTLRAAGLPGVVLPPRRPRFAHGLEVDCGALTIVGTFHPSQQNTFTGRLTPAMVDAVFDRAGYLIRASSSPTP